MKMLQLEKVNNYSAQNYLVYAFKETSHKIFLHLKKNRIMH